MTRGTVVTEDSAFVTVLWSERLCMGGRESTHHSEDLLRATAIESGRSSF